MKIDIEDRKIRRVLLFVIDLILINLSAFWALKIGFNFEVSAEYLGYRETLINYLPYYSLIVIGSFYLFGLYSSLWQYASVKEMLSIVASSLFSILLNFIALSIMNIELTINFYIINVFLLVASSGITRLSYRMGRIFKVYYSEKLGNISSAESSKVVIIGAGEAGVMVAKEIQSHENINKVIVGFLDDDKKKVGSRIGGIRVNEGIDNLEELMEDIHIDEVVFAIPSLARERKREILEKYNKLNVKLNIVPQMYEFVDRKRRKGSMRSVEIRDLLGREPIELNNPEIKKYIKGKTVMVTGGGGSIGSELSRQISRFKPKLLIIFDIYENNAYDIQNELKRDHGDELELKVLIGSVRDKERLEEVFKEYRPDFVFHAAAHKHVPLMQESPFEAIKNNSIGTLNTAGMAGKYGVERFVLISTDKAVNPTNIMGASKRLAEIGLQGLNQKFKNTDFMAVRFGNVLGSNGSVIPLFEKQIKDGGPVTVTHPDIIRYFMTIPEAVALVLQAGSMAMGGEVFVLDMGEPVKVLDLAKNLIRLSGFEPSKDIEIEFVGLRPGEKLFEELLLDEENLKKTPYKKIFVISSIDMEEESINELFVGLNKAIKEKDLECLEKCILDLVPNYRKISHEEEKL